MNHSIIHATIFTLLATASIEAQTCRVAPDNNFGPSAICSSTPFGAGNFKPATANQRYQTKLTRADMGNAPLTVRELFFAACDAGIHQSQQITVRMAHHDGNLSPDFDANLGGDFVTVLHADQHMWELVARQWSPLGLDRPFNYDPGKGDLLVEVLVLGNQTNFANSFGFFRGQRPRVHAANWNGQPPATGSLDIGALKIRVCDNGGGAITNYGRGCGQNPLRMVATGLPNIGNPLDLYVADGLPHSNGLMFFGARRQNMPLDLLGMAGCTLLVDIGVTAGLRFDGTGTSDQLTLQIPYNKGFVDGVIYVQGANFNRNANALGVTSSDAVALKAGKKPSKTVRVGRTKRISVGFGTAVTKVTSSNPAIATVRPDNRAAGGGFKVTGVRRGTVTVTVEYTEGGKTKTQTVCVTVE